MQRRIGAGAAALLIAAGATSAAPEPSGEPPALRRGDDALLLDDVAEIAARVERLRDQRFVRPPFAVRVADDLRVVAAEIRAFDVLPRERLEARQRAWADLGLAASPRNLLVALAADLEGIGFDPRANRLLVAPDRLPAADFEPTGRDDDPANLLLLTGMRPDETAVAHALMHVRQRERAGRDVLEPTTDGLIAAAAWAEGEANLVALRYLFAGLGLGEDALRLVADPGEVLDGGLVPVGLSDAPGAEQELLGFVFRLGYARAAERQRAGGWKALDEAMARRKTTRDLLHPDRAALVPASFPEPRPPREGLHLADEDSLGEQAVAVLVATLTAKDSLGLSAAEGWAGDRVYRWEPVARGTAAGGITEWVTRWSVAAGQTDEAADFDYAYGRALEQRFPGRTFGAVGEGQRTLATTDRVYRITRRDAEVRVLVQPLE